MISISFGITAKDAYGIPMETMQFFGSIEGKIITIAGFNTRWIVAQVKTLLVFELISGIGH
ncbi:MAG: hypothetical protein AAFY17_11890 [Cyanobacteria bacterium J06642_11]